MLSLGSGPRSGKGDDRWTPPVLKSVASRGEGIIEIVDAIDAHGEWLASTGELRQRRLARAASEIDVIAVGLLRSRVGALAGLEQLAQRVVDGECDPYAAADSLVADLTR